MNKQAKVNDVLEGNKFIAEFMGAKWVKDDYNEYGYAFDVYPTKHSGKWWDAHALQYNESWDWLMPAVKKFRDYLQNMERPSRNHCCKGDMLEVDLQCYLWELDIVKVFKALLPCIEWYNNQNKQS